jgi:hypothetical protein
LQYGAWAGRPFQSPVHRARYKKEQRDEKTDGELRTVLQSVKDNMVVHAESSFSTNTELLPPSS